MKRLILTSLCVTIVTTMVFPLPPAAFQRRRVVAESNDTKLALYLAK